MKKITTISLLFAFCIIGLFFGCSEKSKLHIYNWTDYIDPSVIQEFEKENNCQVIIDAFDDNEQALSKLLAGAGGYDVMFPSSYIVETLTQNNLIDRIDISKLSMVAVNFDEKYRQHLLSTNMEWSVPYAFSTTGYAYRYDKVKDTLDSWMCVTNEYFSGRVCILNDIREVLGIGLKLNGFSVNSQIQTELDASVKTMRKLKSVVKKMDNLQYKTGLVSGEFYIAMGYNSDILQVIQENPDCPIKFFIPKEGSTCCFDEMVIMKNSKVKDLAYKFIDFMYRPEIAAKNASYICTAVPNKNMKKFMSEDEVKLIDIPEKTLSNLELIRDVKSGLKLYNKAWDILKRIDAN